MKLTHLDAAALRALEEALRRGEANTLELGTRLPPGFRADQIIPLFDAVEAKNVSLRTTLRELLPAPASAAPVPWRVSVVIPTNRGTPIGLSAFRDQDCPVEVLVLANGDAMPEGDRVVRVPWRGHGATRQEGAALATGDYVLFTVDDALPRGRSCVRALVCALEDGGYDAVFGRQIPWPTADIITAERLAAWTPPGRGHRRVEQHDHVFALYRRSTLLRAPLPDVPIGEDLVWRQNRRIGYVPAAVVVHSHPREPRALYRRTRDLHRQHVAVGEAPRIPSFSALLRALPGVVQPVLRAGPAELPNQLAELLGQWRGGR